MELIFDSDNSERSTSLTTLSDLALEGNEALTALLSLGSGNFPRVTVDPNLATITIEDATES